ncbi:hypothetical protein D9M70_555720 [compost metagenome]
MALLLRPGRMTLREYWWAKLGSMPLEALLARLRLMVPVGAMELWWVKRAPTSASSATSSGACSAMRCM